MCATASGTPLYQATSTATLTNATGYTGTATVVTDVNGSVGAATFSSTTTGSVTPP